MRTLPDRVKPHSRILFIGTNPGMRSVSIGHYFAGRGNLFWKLLYESGLTDIFLRTELDYILPKYGYSLTDVIKRPTNSTTMLSKTDAIGAKKRINRLIMKYKPAVA